jgi:hypothetical protein
VRKKFSPQICLREAASAKARDTVAQRKPEFVALGRSMTLRLHPFLLFLLVFLPVAAQERFSREVISDNFSSDSLGQWEVRSDTEGLYLVQDGEYLLRRHAPSEAAVISPRLLTCPAFELKTSLKVDATKGNPGYAGIVFMMQENNSGGFLLEVNTKKQFRVRQVIQGSYRLLSGTLQSEGWTTRNIVSGPGQYNLLRIVYSDKSYELYLNETLVKAFSEPAYHAGRFGFVIGPATTARVDYIHVSATKECPADQETIRKTPAGQTTDSLVMIRRLELEVQQLKNELNHLRDSLKQKGQKK